MAVQKAAERKVVQKADAFLAECEFLAVVLVAVVALALASSL